MSNYPPGVGDMDEHFNLPNAHDDKPDLYGLRLDVYDGQVMNMEVFAGNSRLALTLEEIRDAHKEYSDRNPKGRYSIVPLSESVNTASKKVFPGTALSDDVDQHGRRIPFYPSGWCEGCGQYVHIDLPPDSHTRSGHDCSGDDRACQTRCPVPMLCGPVKKASED